MKLPSDDYHPHYEGYGWPDGKSLPIRKKKTNRSKQSARRRLLRLLVLQGSRCFYCGGKATPENSNVDHVVPISAGGSSKFNNLVASHIQCNLRKGSRLPTREELICLQALHIDFKG